MSRYFKTFFLLLFLVGGLQVFTPVPVHADEDGQQNSPSGQSSVGKITCTGQNSDGSFIPANCNYLAGLPLNEAISQKCKNYFPLDCSNILGTSSKSKAPSGSTLYNPLGSGVTIESFIGRLIKALLGLSGSVALLMFVWGGFQYLIAGGDSKKVEKGKETLKNAGLGLFIIFFAYTLLNTVLKILMSGTVA